MFSKTNNDDGINGKLSRIGSDWVHYRNGKIDSVGNQDVHYRNGRLDRIGNDDVHYRSGLIEYVGNREVHYRDGKIDRIGNLSVYYEEIYAENRYQYILTTPPINTNSYPITFYTLPVPKKMAPSVKSQKKNCCVII